MRKRLTFILSLLVMAIGAYAQSGNGGELTQRSSTPSEKNRSGREIKVKTKDYKYEISVGPRIGAGLAMMSESGELKEIGLSDGPGFGFNAGLALNIRYGNKDSKGRPIHGQGLFGVGLELNYASMSLKTKPGDDLKLGYFEVPLLLQIYPAYGSKQLKNLFLEVGPTFSMLLSSSPDEIKVSEYRKYMTGDLKGGDVKFTVGCGYRFNRASANDGFYAGLRYNFGTSKLAGNFPAKVSTAEITIGYLFKCIGSKKGNQRANKRGRATILE